MVVLGLGWLAGLWFISSSCVRFLHLLFLSLSSLFPLDLVHLESLIPSLASGVCFAVYIIYF